MAKKQTARRRATQSARRSKVAAKQTLRRSVGKRRTAPARPTASRPGRTAGGVLFAPVVGAERRLIGGVQLEVGRAGAARVKRAIYPPGFRWSRDMKPIVGTELCTHAHVGFLVHGEIHIEYSDGCVIEYRAPQIVAIEPGHDGWVVGDEPVVLVEFDFERETVTRLGMPTAHGH